MFTLEKQKTSGGARTTADKKIWLESEASGCIEATFGGQVTAPLRLASLYNSGT